MKGNWTSLLVKHDKQPSRVDGYFPNQAENVLTSAVHSSAHVNVTVRLEASLSAGSGSITTPVQTCLGERYVFNNRKDIKISTHVLPWSHCAWRECDACEASQHLMQATLCDITAIAGSSNIDHTWWEGSGAAHQIILPPDLSVFTLVDMPCYFVSKEISLTAFRSVVLEHFSSARYMIIMC